MYKYRNFQLSELLSPSYATPATHVCVCNLTTRQYKPANGLCKRNWYLFPKLDPLSGIYYSSKTDQLLRFYRMVLK